MEEHRISQIMKSVASCLPQDYTKKITNHSTRKMVVAKFKAAGQPRHNIAQVTGHARESSLDDFDEITDRRKKAIVSHIVVSLYQQHLSRVHVYDLQLPLAWNLLPPATLPECVMKEKGPLIHLGCCLSTCQFNLLQRRQNIVWISWHISN